MKKSEIPSPEFHQEIFGSPLSQTLVDLKSPSKCDRGRALKLLAIHFTRLIDLDFKGWLLKSADSSSIEVVMVANDKRVPFNRWLIQCRNACQTDMGEIATAVGRSISFKPNILLSVTTGCFTQQACHYVTRAMQLTHLQILLIDTHDLRAIVNDETTIRSILGRETEQAKSTKELQIAPSILDVTGGGDGYCS